jgi:hypothetical protein
MELSFFRVWRVTESRWIFAVKLIGGIVELYYLNKRTVLILFKDHCNYEKKV